ncbi:hypothetical protein ACI3LZ_002348, partial [Candidozyma auris]
ACRKLFSELKPKDLHTKEQSPLKGNSIIRKVGSDIEEDEEDVHEREEEQEDGGLIPDPRP